MFQVLPGSYLGKDLSPDHGLWRLGEGSDGEHENTGKWALLSGKIDHCRAVDSTEANVYSFLCQIISLFDFEVMFVFIGS